MIFFQKQNPAGSNWIDQIQSFKVKVLNFLHGGTVTYLVLRYLVFFDVLFHSFNKNPSELLWFLCSMNDFPDVEVLYHQTIVGGANDFATDVVSELDRRTTNSWWNDTRLESDLWGNESPKCKHSHILVSIGVINTI